MRLALPPVKEAKLNDQVFKALEYLQHMFYHDSVEVVEDISVNGADCVDAVGVLLSAMGLRPVSAFDRLGDDIKAIIIYTGTRAPNGILTYLHENTENASLMTLVEEGYMEYEHRISAPGIHLRLTDLGMEAFDALTAEDNGAIESLKEITLRLLESLRLEHAHAHDDNGGRVHCQICKAIKDAEKVC